MWNLPWTLWRRKFLENSSEFENQPWDILTDRNFWFFLNIFAVSKFTDIDSDNTVDSVVIIGSYLNNIQEGLLHVSFIIISIIVNVYIIL